MVRSEEYKARLRVGLYEVAVRALSPMRSKESRRAIRAILVGMERDLNTVARAEVQMTPEEIAALNREIGRWVDPGTVDEEFCEYAELEKRFMDGEGMVCHCTAREGGWIQTDLTEKNHGKR